MRQWISSVAAASVLAALALALTPKGRVRQVTKLVCGVMCALAVAAPVAKLDFGQLAADMALYEKRAREITSQAQEEAKMLDRTYIEQRCEAYILGKAAAAGAAVDSVTVTARWDDGALVWYPWSVSLDGPFHQGLADAIEGELGIPAGRQSWGRDG